MARGKTRTETEELDMRSNSTRVQLASFIERLENLDEEAADFRKRLADDRFVIRNEARGMGFDAKVITEVLRRRREDKRRAALDGEVQSLTDLYAMMLD